ncbi:MAG: 2-C-methyl-D-erythritol 4-phosphate cytidylyltransferase [Planctomycetota bacterium]|nr:2-C-methyl-D-erythritol 4-phosphate cytidylyltransferase [Planctomycetota bacterium]
MSDFTQLFADVAVILPAAGRSSRFSLQNKKKPFIELKGRPVWVRSAEVFLNRDDVAQVIVVIASDDMDFFREKFRANLAFMGVEIVEGGAERMDSVKNGLSRLKDGVKFVAVHDAARPLIVKPWIDKLFQEARQSGAVIPAIPISSTIKRVDPSNTIRDTVSRDGLWAAQTPQVFRRELLEDAYARFGNEPATDEAQLVARTGHDVKVITGSPMNIKITTNDDFRMAESLLSALPKDKAFRRLHPFADEQPTGLFD